MRAPQRGEIPVTGDLLVLVCLAIAAFLTLVAILFVRDVFNIWLQALLSRAPVSFFALVRTRLSRVNPRPIVFARIRASQAGINVSYDWLLAHQQAGGNPEDVVRAVVQARSAGERLSLEAAARADLATPSGAGPARRA